MTTLKYLNLEGVGYPAEDVLLTDNGVTRLVSLENLESLHLGKTNVGDDGILALSALGKLETLDINACRHISNAGVTRLQAAKTNLQIRQ